MMPSGASETSCRELAPFHYVHPVNNNNNNNDDNTNNNNTNNNTDIEPSCRELAAGGRAPRARGSEAPADVPGSDVTDRAYQREYLAPDAKRSRRD